MCYSLPCPLAQYPAAIKCRSGEPEDIKNNNYLSACCENNRQVAFKGEVNADNLEMFDIF